MVWKLVKSSSEVSGKSSSSLYSSKSSFTFLFKEASYIISSLIFVFAL
jgi:hypothetical protein